MVTKEQAMIATRFKQVAYFPEVGRQLTQDMQMRIICDVTKLIPMEKPKNWRASGNCKIWKTRPDEFKLPIKYGLYESSYLTHENAHLFEVAE